jgi:uncharacterized membrane protein
MPRPVQLAHIKRASSNRSALIAAGILGFAFGGFFDGIVLHQVLQWHHFLSLAEGERYRDIRTQILADGLFHVVVYIVAAAGLWLLWRRGTARPSDRLIAAAALLGFAVWQFADVVIFHWIIGIHRIRVDVPNPMVWDIGWLVVFGLPSLVLGMWLLRRGRGDAGGSQSRVAALVLSAALAVAIPISAIPAAGGTTLVVFRPGIGATQSFSAIAAIGGRIIWSDPSGELVAIDSSAGTGRWRLYGHGALLVGSSGWLAGCLGWTRV